MKDRDWIFTVRHYSGEEARRKSVVGPACASTVEAALHLASLTEDLRAEIRADATVREFVDGLLDHDASGYYVHPPARAGRVARGTGGAPAAVDVPGARPSEHKLRARFRDIQLADEALGPSSWVVCIGPVHAVVR